MNETNGTNERVTSKHNGLLCQSTSLDLRTGSVFSDSAFTSAVLGQAAYIAANLAL